MKNRTRTIAFMGLFTSIALILAYVEAIIPPIFPAIPGIKVGLPNIIIIFMLYRRSAWSAIGVSLMRLVLVALLFGNAMTFMYSLAGAALSLAVMILLKRLNFLSTVGVSVAGAVSHNVGQILIAILLLNTTEIAYYLVVLTVTGVIAGVFIGLCGAELVKKVPKIEHSSR